MLVFPLPLELILTCLSSGQQWTLCGSQICEASVCLPLIAVSPLRRGYLAWKMVYFIQVPTRVMFIKRAVKFPAYHMKFSLITIVLLLPLWKHTAADLTKKYIQITRSQPVAGQQISVLKASAGVGTGTSNGPHKLSAWGSSSEFKLNQLPRSDSFVAVWIKRSYGVKSVSPCTHSNQRGSLQGKPPKGGLAWNGDGAELPPVQQGCCS